MERRFGIRLFCVGMVLLLAGGGASIVPAGSVAHGAMSAKKTCKTVKKKVHGKTKKVKVCKAAVALPTSTPTNTPTATPLPTNTPAPAPARLIWTPPSACSGPSSCVIGSAAVQLGTAESNNNGVDTILPGPGDTNAGYNFSWQVSDYQVSQYPSQGQYSIYAYVDDKLIAGAGSYTGPDDYLLVESNGHPYQTVPVDGSHTPALQGKNIYPGEENAGWVQFDAPVLDANYTLFYQVGTTRGYCECYAVANLHLIPGASG